MNKRITESFTKGKHLFRLLPRGSVTGGDRAACICHGGSRADLIELGIPFFDPTAEPPGDPGGNVRAPSGGVTTDKVLIWLRRSEEFQYSDGAYDICKCSVFLWNRAFCEKAAEVGMDGLILPDVPV